MSGFAYYNEFDKHAAAWLRNLIARNLIAPGEVDERSITEVHPDDLRGFTQCHFFAGIGGWSYALRLAGWPDDRPVWTGSCPCQPFSAAGKQRGSNDERHLWPTFFDLIRECRPASVFGEQVAGSAGLAWLDHVCADLEGAEYAAAAADLPACSVGAPHLRSRLWWVAHAQARGLGIDRSTSRATGYAAQRHAVGGLAFPDQGQRGPGRHGAGSQNGSHAEPAGSGSVGSLANAECGATERLGLDLGSPARGDEAEARQRQRIRPEPGPSGHAGVGLADATEQGPQGGEQPGQRVDAQRAAFERSGPLDPWASIEWISCRDGKARPTEPGLFPLAHGVSGRVGRLRAYGNAIVPQVAAAFVRAAA